jgi:cytochrome d ubiquinol oxidase subunit I
VFAGVGAWHVLKDKGSIIGRKSLRLGVILGLVFALIEAIPLGHWHAEQVAHTQPEKFAAIEGHYTGQTRAPLILFAIPLPASPVPDLWAKVEVPRLLSQLAFDDADAYVKGILDFPPEDRPPLIVPFLSYRTMVTLGLFFIALMALAAFRLWQGRLYTDRKLLRVLVWSIPLPVLAIELGWITAEVGRQPWIIYKVMRTAEAASPTVSAGEIGLSIAIFSVVYAALFAVWLFLMIRAAKEEPLARSA